RLPLQHHAHIPAIAIAPHPTIRATHATVFVCDRSAKEPARTDFALSAKLVRVGIIVKARTTLAAILLRPTSACQPPKAIALASHRIYTCKGGARQHGVGELP